MRHNELTILKRAFTLPLLQELHQKATSWRNSQRSICIANNRWTLISLYSLVHQRLYTMICHYLMLEVNNAIKCYYPNLIPQVSSSLLMQLLLTETRKSQAWGASSTSRLWALPKTNNQDSSTHKIQRKKSEGNGSQGPLRWLSG